MARTAGEAAFIAYMGASPVARTHGIARWEDVPMSEWPAWETAALAAKEHFDKMAKESGEPT